MATIKNKSLEEIENKIQAIEEDSQRLKKKLKITSKERLKRFISMIRKENTQYKLDKKAIKGQIKSNKDTINELERDFRKSCVNGNFYLPHEASK